MQQSYDGEMECLVVDDCGTDDSIPIAKRMIETYTGPIRFEILHHEHNRGLSAARNTGTLQAKGDYLYYLDSDDFITDDCIEKLMAVALDDPDIEMVQGKYSIYGKNKSYPIEQKHQLTHAKTNQEVRECFLFHNQFVISAWNKLIKRQFILNHHILFKEGLVYEDVLWRFYLIKYINNVYFYSDITYYYNKRPGSIITETGKKTSAYHRCIIYKDILANLTPKYEREEFLWYAKDLSSIFIRYGYYYPAMKDVIFLYWKKAMQMKCFSICLILSMGYVLGRFKYGWPIFKRLKNPTLIPRDIQRIWRQMRSKKA